MSIETVKEKIIPVFKQYGVTKAALFGSVVRGEDTAESDVDVLVDLHRPFGLARFVALKRDLQAVLNKRVDVVEYGGVKPSLVDSILKDAKVIYEQR